MENSGSSQWKSKCEGKGNRTRDINPGRAERIGIGHTSGCAQVNKRVCISELTLVSAPSIMLQMEKWRDGHDDPSTDFLLRVVRRDMGTLVIVLLVLFLLGGGGWGYSRWRR